MSLEDKRATKPERIIIYDSCGEEVVIPKKSSTNAWLLLLFVPFAAMFIILLKPTQKEQQHDGVREASIQESYGDIPYLISPPFDAPPVLTFIVRDDHPWTIKFASSEYCESHGWDGLTDRGSRTVWIKGDVTPYRMRVIVFHELMHVGYSRSEWPSREFKTENDFVTKAAPVMRDILLDNPELAKWILEKRDAD